MHAAQETKDDPVGAAPPAEAAAVAPGTQPVPVAAALPVAAAVPGGGLAAAPAVAQPRTTRPRPEDGQRVGTWRSEERQYVTEVILRFGEGRLPNVPDNTSLRVLLLNVLNCSPMRITKKFSGRNALPRGRCRRAGGRGRREAAHARARFPPARPGRWRGADHNSLRHVRPAYGGGHRRRCCRRRLRRAGGSRGGDRSTVADREAIALEGSDCVLRRTDLRRALHRRNDLCCGSGRAATATGARGRARDDFDRHCWTAGLDAGPAHHAGPGRGWRTCRNSRTCSGRAHGRAAGCSHERLCLLSGRFCVSKHLLYIFSFPGPVP